MENSDLLKVNRGWEGRVMNLFTFRKTLNFEKTAGSEVEVPGASPPSATLMPVLCRVWESYSSPKQMNNGPHGRGRGGVMRTWMLENLSPEKEAAPSHTWWLRLLPEPHPRPSWLPSGRAHVPAPRDCLGVGVGLLWARGTTFLFHKFLSPRQQMSILNSSAANITMFKLTL